MKNLSGFIACILFATIFAACGGAGGSVFDSDAARAATFIKTASTEQELAEACVVRGKHAVENCPSGVFHPFAKADTLEVIKKTFTKSGKHMDAALVALDSASAIITASKNEGVWVTSTKASIEEVKKKLQKTLDQDDANRQFYKDQWISKAL